jgi:hypothetical protein
VADDLRDGLIDRGFVWQQVTPLGSHTSASAVSAGPTALLAGFSLAALVTNVVEVSTRTAWDDLAALFFATAVACLLVSLRLFLLAQRWQASPSDLLAWSPEATVNVPELNRVRQQQRLHDTLYFAYAQRAGAWLPWGTAAALGGLAFQCAAVTPKSSPLLVVAVVVLGVAGVIALIEVIGRPKMLFGDAGLRRRAERDLERLRNAGAPPADYSLPGIDPRAKAFIPRPLHPVGLRAIIGEHVDGVPNGVVEMAAFMERAEARGVATLAGAFFNAGLVAFGDYTVRQSSLVFLVATGPAALVDAVGLHLSGRSAHGGVLVSVHADAVAQHLGRPLEHVTSSIPASFTTDDVHAPGLGSFGFVTDFSEIASLFQT